MKTWKKTACLVLAILLLVLAGLIFWQKDNLGALILYINADSETITEQKEQLDQDHKEELSAETGEDISANLPSTDQCTALLNGDLTAQQVKDDLGLTGGLDVPLEIGDSLTTKGSIVNQCAAELAAYKIDVMENLGTVKADLLAQWIALEPTERTPTKKAALAAEALRQCLAYETQIDTAVEACLDRYREALEAIGEDTAVIGILWDQYEEEKQTEKAFYLDRYLN